MLSIGWWQHNEAEGHILQDAFGAGRAASSHLVGGGSGGDGANSSSGENGAAQLVRHVQLLAAVARTTQRRVLRRMDKTLRTCLPTANSVDLRRKRRTTRGSWRAVVAQASPYASEGEGMLDTRASYMAQIMLVRGER